MGRPKGPRSELNELLWGSGGAILFEGDSRIDSAPIMVIGTGIMPKSLANTKLGDSIQLWIIRSDISPTEAVKSSLDDSICGDCKLRPQEEHGKFRACYVNIGMPEKIYEAWERGRYPNLSKRQDLWPRIFGNRVIRIGAYGDPVAVSHPVWEEMLETARGWIGYTHGWHYAPAAFKRILMASVDSPEERKEAKRSRWPWRTFRSRFEHEPLLPGEIECPAQPRIYKPRIKARILQGRAPKTPPTCEGCRLCNGLQYLPDLRSDLSVVVHGWSPAVSAYTIARSRGSLPVLTNHFY